MKKVICILLLCLQTLAGVADNTPKSVVDSLLTQLETLPHDTTRLELLQKLALASQNSSRSLEFADRFFKEAQQQKDDYYICNAAYFHVLHYYNNEGEQDSVAKWVNFIKPIAQDIKYWKIYFNSQRILINIYIYNHQYEYAFNEATLMLEKARKTRSVNGESAAYQCLATVYHQTNRWKEEEKILKKAYALLPQITHSGSQINILFQLVNFCKFRKNYADMKTYLDNIKAVLEEMISKNPEMLESFFDQYLYLEIYYTYLYLGTNEPEQAKVHYEKGQTYITPDTFLPYLVSYQNLTIDYCLYTKEYETALATVDSALHLVRKYEFGESDYAKELRYKADILKSMERYSEALPLYERINQIQDSISTAVSNRQLEEIKDSYHLNQLLLEQGQLRSYIQTIILAVVSVILILCIFYILHISRLRKELRLSEKETKETTLKTEEANEMKGRFLSNMSHAIRVPLNSVVGFSQLMASPVEIEETTRQEYSNIIQQNTEKLMLLVNNVLDLSRLEADMMKFQLMDADIVQLCNDAIGAVRMQHPNIKVHFQNNVEQCILHTDCNRIMQIIISTLAGSSTASQEKQEIHFSLDKKGDILYFKVTNSPLADKKHASQETSIRHDINRLLLKHFGGTYQIITDDTTAPTVLFTYPAASLQ